MKIDIIKKSVAHLPHVKTVWVKNNNVYIHPVQEAEKVDLDAVQTIAPTEDTDTTSTNKKKNK